ncbi:serine-rich coiled-coil domain-containing protein 2 isoform X3 [Hyperolius riggenbachi]|uniref:serine-rich coiled-coil domain-containing protein 2 isoform X3 n=1 Tax=Hyperolius riggenbachi TaxID=752182 RepID=UPI0035A2B90E
MEEKFQLRGSLGSKLPKFGTSKPAGTFLQQTQNGTCNGIPAKGNYGGGKYIENERTSAFSLSWSKTKSQQNDLISRAPPNLGIEKTSSRSQVMVQNDTHRLGVMKPGKQSNMLVSHKEDLNENVLSSSTKYTKGTQFGRTYSGLNGHKTSVNGFYASKPPSGLYRPRANSATSRNFPSNILPSDNKLFSCVRRSQSFSHSIPNSKFQSATLTRSYSLHRDTDMAKVFQSQHLPSRTDLKPRFAKQYGLPNGNDQDIKSMFTRTYSAGLTTGLKKPVFTNGTAASAPLGYRMTRPSLQKATRSQYPKETMDGTKSTSVAPVNQKTELLSNGTCQTRDNTNKREAESLATDNLTSDDLLDRQDFKDSYFSEDIDELSISSLSSSDKNDFSEDFSDDFLDLEDGTKTVILEALENKLPEKPSQYSLSEPQTEIQCKSNNQDEWIDMNMSDLEDGNKTYTVQKSEKSLSKDPSLYSLGDLQPEKQHGSSNSEEWIVMSTTVQNDAESKSHPYAESRISPDMDYRDPPSSLELSPSDSSDGTYMWDEEGMEPIGNVRRCESYESSEMNSLDILNNIETCDLEEDDLMLDVEIPEDPPCDSSESENMSRFDRSERSLRQQPLFWKRNPPRLNGQEQYHLSNPENYHNGRGSSCLESPTDKKDCFGSPYCSPLSPRSPQMLGLQENTVMLDEMTLRHMVQDCTTVKTQLLKLKRMLQQEDDPESPVLDLQLFLPSAPEPRDTVTVLKTEDLLSEIQQLKEESRKKDDMIKQLQEQLKTRCKCQKEPPEAKVEKAKQHEKYTQTTWRRSSVLPVAFTELCMDFDYSQAAACTELCLNFDCSLPATCTDLCLDFNYSLPPPALTSTWVFTTLCLPPKTDSKGNKV